MVGAGAFATTAGVTSGLKSLTSRERPNGSSDDSFLLQLTRLKQLTELHYRGPFNGNDNVAIELVRLWASGVWV